ncbi:MAG TPA: hypothetical protein VFQ61_03315 [Polyangiaceae bacterium]|nr:hypothetical protein [Polyangiaceae bacterium]
MPRGLLPALLVPCRRSSTPLAWALTTWTISIACTVETGGHVFSGAAAGAGAATGEGAAAGERVGAGAAAGAGGEGSNSTSGLAGSDDRGVDAGMPREPLTGGAGGAHEYGGTSSLAEAGHDSHPDASGGRDQAGATGAEGGAIDAAGGQFNPTGGVTNDTGGTGACDDLATDSENCGRCGHSCGGGDCRAGVCQPMVVVGNLGTVNGLAIDRDEVFFTQGPTGTLTAGSDTASVLACPSNGCVLAPRQIAGGLSRASSAFVVGDSLAVLGSEAAPYPLTALMVVSKSGTNKNYLTPNAGKGMAGLGTADVAINGSDLFFLRVGPLATGGSPAKLVNVCRGVASGKCTEQVTLGARAVNPPFAADSQRIYFFEAGGLVTCPILSGCDSTTSLVASAGAPDKMKIWGDNIYLLNARKISSCPLSGCSEPASVRAQFGPDMIDFAIDDNAVFWLEDSNVQTCPLPDCPGGPRRLAKDQHAPSSIAVHNGFVYWVDAGMPKDGSFEEGTAAILRVAL